MVLLAAADLNFRLCMRMRDSLRRLPDMTSCDIIDLCARISDGVASECGFTQDPKC